MRAFHLLIRKALEILFSHFRKRENVLSSSSVGSTTFHSFSSSRTDPSARKCVLENSLPLATKYVVVLNISSSVVKRFGFIFHSAPWSEVDQVESENFVKLLREQKE